MVNPGRGADFVPGAVGPFADNIPPVTQANIRPYAIAILLHRHYLCLSDLVGAIQPFCPSSDLKLGIAEIEADDLTRLEALCIDVLDEMHRDGLLHYNDEHKSWSLVAGDKMENLLTYIHWISITGGQLSRESLSLFR